ncbi:protein of unknown function [Microlunatus sagamiharensis]|uniref:DUF4439 domain-containing protein n=1 Tax=Microlunatus sagamiharensis TaxID=546874 RepID=A0A1H2LUA0_9ACTN|nr:protein of unknown function [Microlunatus sagamiharensis]
MAEGLGYVRAVPEAPHAALGHDRSRWARRDVLRIGLGLGLGAPLLGACTTSPTVLPGPGTSGRATSGPAGPTPGSASPAPAPTVPAGAASEQALSVRAAAVLDGPHRKDLGADRRALLTFLRDAHADHAVALAGPDPTTRPTTAVPSPSAAPPDVSGQSLAASMKALARAESAQAAAQRRAAAAASGLEALVAGSLAVAAETYAAALGASRTPGVGRAREHRATPLLSDVEASAELVAQLHAVVYGYQLAIGVLKYSSAARRRAVGELASARTLLDAQISFLLSRKADVPPAEPAYAPSPAVRSPADATRLVRGMQYRLAPFVGLTLAAAGSAGARTVALTQLRSTVRTSVTWGAGLQVWPGWPD